MMKTLFIFPSFLYIFFLSSCITSFQTTQNAKTLQPRHFEYDGNIGLFRCDAGIRGGITKRMDMGIYLYPTIALFDENLAGASADIKYRIYSGTGNYFLSSGFGFGLGSEWLIIYSVAMYEHGDLDGAVAQSLGDPALDLYLSVYNTFSFSTGENRGVNIFCNPFLIYRLGRYKGYKEFEYEKINDVYPGVSLGTIWDFPKMSFSLNLTYMYYYNNHIELDFDPYIGHDEFQGIEGTLGINGLFSHKKRE